MLAYGKSAVGWRIGEENRGLEYMFTMMNNARLNVGVQGLAIAERAYQQARDFARAADAGTPIGASPEVGALPIIHHPDVRRMLLWMRAATEAMRALAYYAAAAIDRGRRQPDPAERLRAQHRADLLIPVVKAWCTDLGVDVASTGIQVHGGMGYIEETGAAQHLRDARIAPIYEGTNGIQAGDLVGRKLGRDHGEAARALFDEIGANLADLARADRSDLIVIGQALAPGWRRSKRDRPARRERRRDGGGRCGALSPDVRHRLRGLADGTPGARRRSPAAAGDGDPAFFRSKLATARFYADHFLALAPGILPGVLGGATVLAFDPDQF